MNKKWEIVASEFGDAFVKENLMEPNSVKIMAELAESLDLCPSMKMLDLGCGKGLTSFYLAKYFDVTVFATDLWINAAENYARILQLGMEDKVFPIHADARSLPYAKGFFDIAVSGRCLSLFRNGRKLSGHSFCAFGKIRGYVGDCCSRSNGGVL